MRQLIAVTGLLYVAISTIYLLLQSETEPLTFTSWRTAVGWLGALTLAAAGSSIAAGLARSARRHWPLLFNGLALAALGVIYSALTPYRIRLLTIAPDCRDGCEYECSRMLVAQALGHAGRAGEALALKLAAVLSIGFAFAFLALGLRWIKLGPGSHLDLLWLGGYFGLSAICMLGLALRSDNVVFSIGRP